VLRGDFRAVKTSAPASSEFPEVMLADYRVAYRSDGWLGSAVFDCMPGEHLTCRIQIPRGCHIAECRVAGRPAVAVAESPLVWRLTLGFKRLPQRIELMFLCPPSEKDAVAGSLEVPRLLDLPVRRTLWTVAGTEEIHPRIAAEMLRSRWDQERIRLQSAVSTVADAAAIAAEEPAAEIQAWYRHWSTPLAASRDSLDRLLATGKLGAQRRRVIDSLTATLEQHALVEQRLGVRPGVSAGAVGTVAVRPAGELWDWATRSVPGLTTFIVQGESSTLNFDRRDDATAATLIRVLAAAALLLLAGLLAYGIRRGRLSDWFWRWPRACGVAFGLAWWLWLSPSFLGWVWIALSLFVFRPAAWKSKRDVLRGAYREQLAVG
jgi:hypothetical protein